MILRYCGKTSGAHRKHFLILKGTMMSNRQNVIKAIRDVNNKKLNHEIEYMMDEEREYAYDEADALSDVLDIAECNNDRSIIKLSRIVLIKAGGFVPEPVKNDIGRDSRFTLNSIKYCWPREGGLESWINK